MSVKLTTAMDMYDFSWKVEPMSPDLGNLDVETETWLFNDDDVAAQPYTVKDEKPVVPSSFNRGEVAAKLLEDLNDWIKEEPFPEWMEEKGDLGIFESLSLETNDLAISDAVKKLAAEHKEDDTSFLLQEFQSIYEQIEQSNASLTPPQSPSLVPCYSEFVVGTPQQLGSVQFIQVTPVVPVTFINQKEELVVPITFKEKLEDPLLNTFEQIVPVTPSTDLAHEMTVVDDIVRMCADKMVPDESGNTTVRTWVEKVEQVSPIEQPSPISSTSDSDSEVLYNYPLSPGMSSSSSSGDEDPDYAPSIIAHSSGTSKGSRGRKRSAKEYIASAPDVKKMRKKEQNKNAATRYRKKKKAEIGEILGEERELEVKNEELNKQVEDLSREIRYLKGFMRDIFKAKGLIK